MKIVELVIFLPQMSTVFQDFQRMMKQQMKIQGRQAEISAIAWSVLVGLKLERDSLYAFFEQYFIIF